MTIAIYGATGQTGQALLSRLSPGAAVRVCGRDRDRLDALARASKRPVDVRVAAADVPAELARAFDDARAVVQCAALPAPLAHAVATAAIDRGAAYLDVSADASVAAALHERVGDAAARSGVTLCPGVAPIGGALAEWLAIAAIRELCGAVVHPDAIDLGYCAASLPGSGGSLCSALHMLAALPQWLTAEIEFPPPFGRELGFAFPLGHGHLARYFPDAAIGSWAALVPHGIGSRPTTSALGVAARFLRGAGPQRLLEATRALGPVFARALAPLASHDAALPFAVTARILCRGHEHGLAATAEAPYALTAEMLCLVLAELEHADAGPRGVAEILRAEKALAHLAARKLVRLHHWPDEARPPAAEQP